MSESKESRLLKEELSWYIDTVRSSRMEIGKKRFRWIVKRLANADCKWVWGQEGEMHFWWYMIDSELRWLLKPGLLLVPPKNLEAEVIGKKCAWSAIVSYVHDRWHFCWWVMVEEGSSHVAVPLEKDLLHFPTLPEDVASPWYSLLYSIGKYQMLAARNTFLRALIMAVHDLKGE